MKNFNIYMLILGSLGLIYSCKDGVLNVVPHNELSDATVWSDSGTADLFLNDIYANLPNGNNWIDPWDNYSDNSMCGYGWVASRNFEKESSYTPTTYPSGGLNIDWSYIYGVIRRCNVFMKQAATSNVLTESYKKERVAEARFLRAYFYQILWMCYGGVPVITEPLNRNTMGDSIFYGRSTVEETFKFITEECSAAAEDLPLVPTESGRATKGAALALKGWCELFYASPVYNPGDDKTLWANAAATNEQIMNLHVYHLYPDYGRLFLPAGNINDEGIFYREYYPQLNGGRESSYESAPYTKNGAHTSWGAVNPTQELVDAYGMDNGLPITDPASGYDPQHPYLHREQRFYESIVYDGSWWYNDTVYTRLGVGSPNQLDLADAGDNTNTGYNLRKRMNPDIPLGAANWDGATSNENFYYFRYAEVLLNYAEAQNEAAGPDQSVYDAVNQVRERVTLPALPAGMSREEMRKEIRRERRVELAFEGKRRWDLVRWQTAIEKYSNGLHAMKIEEVNGKLQYTVILAPGGSRKFAPKNYVFPIPQYALDQNGQLKQNAGY